MKTLSIDIETYGSIDLTKSGVYKYTQNDFEILLIAYAYDDEEITFPAVCSDVTGNKNLNCSFSVNLLAD